MYSRKSRGYTPCTPPPNYNGVAFTRDFKAETEIPEKETPPSEPECRCTDTECPCPASDASDESNTEHEDLPDCRECTEQDTNDPDFSKELTVEDLMIIGAVLLFVSGEFDGDIMLLLGLLLIAGV